MKGLARKIEATLRLNGDVTSCFLGAFVEIGICCSLIVMAAPSFVKVLSDNDLGITGGHQVGILIPKAEISRFPQLEEDEKNPRAPIQLFWNGRMFKQGNFIHYNNKKFGGTRDEYRITPFTKRDFRTLGATTGDFLVFGGINSSDFEIDLVAPDSERARDLGLPQGAQPGSAVKPSAEAIADLAEADSQIRNGNYQVPDTFSVTKIRRFQSVFRSMVELNFGGACCLPGCPVDDPRFLEATHIVPWSRNPALRLDPGNGLLLCKNHHVALDSGIITLDQKGVNYVVKVSSRQHESRYVQREIAALEGKALRNPVRHALANACVAYHRKNIFRA